MEKIRNCSVDIFRYFCAILVVCIHTTVFSDINDALSIAFVDIIPRIAVPFFFTVAGYFFINKLKKGEKPFLPYIKRLLMAYIFWSLVYFVWDFILWGHTGIKGFVANFLYTFFVDGSHYHLWFFPALMISATIVYLFYRLNLQRWIPPVAIVVAIVGCLGCAYYEIGVQIPIINKIFDSDYFILLRHDLLLSFPFFVLGSFVGKIKEKTENVSVKTNIFFVVISIFAWLGEILFVTYFELQRDVVISPCLFLMTGAVLLLLLKCPAAKFTKSAKLCKTLAGFTYYFHPLVIEVVGALFEVPSTLLFVLTTVITAVVGFAIYKINNPWLNSIAG